MEVVHEILSGVEKSRDNAIRDIVVDKLIQLDFFPEDILITDANELNYKELHASQEDYLMHSARDCVQSIFNTLSIFPKEFKDGIAFTKCSGSTFCLPREKPLPIPKPLTKWQKFAKEKGLKKSKKPRVTWDDILQKWIPTYGYKKSAADREKDWLIEVPKNIDPSTDMFAEKNRFKKENIAKNEYQRLRNIAAGRKMKVPEFGVPPLEGNMHQTQLRAAAIVAKSSTASLGKFQPSLPGEKDVNCVKKLSKKRLASSTNANANANANDERRSALQVIRQVQEEKSHDMKHQKSVIKNGVKTNRNPKRSANKHSFKKTKSGKEKRSKKRGNSGGKRR